MNTKRTARELAKDIAMRSPCGVQVGAALSDSKGIFSWGWNHYINDNGAWPQVTVHAEEHAITRANPKRLRNKRRRVVLTVFGQRRRSGNLVYSKPCRERCLQLAIKHGVETLEYITKDGKWETLQLEYV